MKRITALIFCFLFCLSLFGCSAGPAKNSSFTDVLPEKTMELSYATGFSVDYYPRGYKLLTLSDGSRYLVVPEGEGIPKNLAEDILPLCQPLQNIYLAAASVMSLTDALGELDAIAFSGIKEEDWHRENARSAMEAGKIQYAGKYSQPDYELLLAGDCRLAIESTMINYAPEAKEKLQELGLTIFIDLSSKEAHPLGRTEWIKLYGALFNKEEEAERLFLEQEALFNSLPENKSTGKTVAFFYVTSAGTVTVRKPDDYIIKMIELAGGEYVFASPENQKIIADSTTLEMESFYAAARDADFVIYNSTNTGELKDLDEFLSLNHLFADFKAVQDGNVWCIGENLFQETIQHGKVILELHELLSDLTISGEELEFFFRLL